MTLGRVVTESFRGIVKHRVTDLAAMLTYYALFALFPFMLFVVTLTLLVLPSAVLDQAFKMMAFALPGEAAALALDQLRRMEATAGGGFAIVGGALAIWSASRGAAALQTVLNRIHEVEETRPWWRQQVVAIGTTLGVSVLSLVALVLLLFGPTIGHLVADRFGLGAELDLLWGIGRWVGAALLVMLVWACLYYFLPDIHRRFRWVTPGAVVGVLLWLAASRGLTYYTDNFGNYDKTYGTLGGVIVFMTWIWMSSLALLVGGEIDDAIDEIRKEREGSGGQVPAAPKKEIVIVEKLIRPPSRELAIADLAKKVGEDITTLAKDHLELALEEVGTGIKSVATDAAMILLGGVVALIGLAMLCVTAVVAVEPVLPTLWLRLLLGALVYLALGSGLVWGFGHRLRGDGFHMKRSVRAGERTAHALKEQVQNG